MIKRWHHIKHIDDNRHNSNNPVINNGCCPGRPASFGSTGHNKTINRFTDIGTDFLNHIHGPDYSPGHGQSRQPLNVLIFSATFHIFPPAIGNNIVLSPVILLIANIIERLEGNVADLGYNRLGSYRCLDQ